MSLALNEVLRVAVRFNNATSGDIVNIHHFKCTASDGTISDSALLSAIEAEMGTLYNNIVSLLRGDIVPVDVKVDRVSMVGGKEIVSANVGIAPFTSFTGGTGGTDSLPSACCMVVTGRTSFPKTRARKFLGIPIEGAQADGILSGSALTTIGTYIVEWLTPFVVGSTGSLTACVWRKADSSSRLILTGIARAVVGYQRRRKAGVGN